MKAPKRKPYRAMKRPMTTSVINKKVLPNLGEIYTLEGLMHYRLTLHDLYDLEENLLYPDGITIKKYGTSEYVFGRLEEVFNEREHWLGIQDELPVHVYN